MLSYRKSQQASLTEKLKKKNVIHVFGASGSGTTMARLCLSAFARVATQAALQLKHCIFFATAHSRGLRRLHQSAQSGLIDLCHSAFARVATMVSAFATAFIVFATAHSRGLRLAQYKFSARMSVFATAHSCGLRLSTCSCCR